MDEFWKMDAFFVVTTLVVLIVGILLAFILYRVLRILKHVEEISQQVSEESALLRGDIAKVRQKARDEGFRLLHFQQFFTSAFKRLSGAPKKRRREGDD